MAGTCEPTNGICSNPQDQNNPPRVIATLPVGGHPAAIALNPTNKRLYVGQDPANSVAVVDTVTKSLLTTIPTAGYQNLGIATNPSTDRVYITQGFANRVLVIDGTTNAPIDDIPVPSSNTIAGIAVNPETNTIYVARNQPGGIIVMDGATNTYGPVIDLGGDFPSISSVGMAIDLTDNRMYVVDRPRDRVVIIDGNTNQLQGSVAVGTDPIGLAVNSTTHRVYVANFNSRTLSIIDTDTGDVIETVSAGNGAAGVAVNPSTNRIYVTNLPYANSVSIIAGDTNDIIETVPVGLDPFGIAIDPTNDLVYVANGADGTVSVIRDCSCIAETCEQMGANCGSIDNGCGETLDCGSCDEPETCGGSGVPNVCGSPGPGECVVPPEGLVSWWRGENNASDSVDGNQETLAGGTTFSSGFVGQGFLLDGVNGFVDLGNSANLRVSSGDFTFETWVYFNGLQNDMSIVDKMQKMVTTDSEDGWRIIKQTDNHFWFCFGRGAGNNGCVSGGPTTVRTYTTVTTGIWYPIAAVKSSTAISIYINGMLEDIKPTAPFVDTNTTNLSIGCIATSTMGRAAYLRGIVDEASIYNRALSASEIRNIFLSGSIGKCTQQ